MSGMFLKIYLNFVFVLRVLGRFLWWMIVFGVKVV